MKSVLSSWGLASCILFFISTNQLFSQCHNNDDYQALRTLYLDGQGETWTDNSGWPLQTVLDNAENIPTGMDMSQWYGVTCSDGRVTELDLSNNNLLLPTLPDNFVRLSNLVLLDFSNNDLGWDNLPDHLLDMDALEVVRLSYTELSGIIPSDIYRLSSLKVLDLSSNRLTGSIPLSLGSISSLEEIHLWSNALSGSIPPTLGGLSNLRTLFLNYNNLEGCFPLDLKSLCSQGTVVSILDNPNMFESWIEFCNDEGCYQPLPLTIKEFYFSKADRTLKWHLENVSTLSSYELQYSRPLIQWKTYKVFDSSDKNESIPTVGEDHYRLAFHHLDGSISYSPIVHISSVDTSDSLLEIFPNPVDSDLKVIPKTEGQLILSNSLGQVIYRSNLSENIVHPLSVSHLPNGIYYISWQTKEDSFIQKLLISH